MDLPADTIAARLDELRGCLRVVAEGGREMAAVLTRLDADAEGAATLAAARSARLDDVERRLERIERDLAGIVKPVQEHYDALRRQREAEEAGRVGLAALITPDRMLSAGKWIAVVATALGLGGGVGAHFRGCGGQIVTAADAASHEEGSREPAKAGSVSGASGDTP